MKLKYRLIFALACVSYALTVNAQAQIDPTHHIETGKNLTVSWMQDLTSNVRQPFTGPQLTTIGMPCGGIAAGQLYIRGDGTLACWWIANDAYNTGYGHASTNNFQTALGAWKSCYQTFTPFSYIDQGFTINGRSLDKTGFNAIEFTGEYPIATIDYKDSEPLPYSIRLQVFSPFIPLDARESGTPGTVLQYTIRNTSSQVQKINLKGNLQNMVGIDGRSSYTGTLRNQVFKKDGLTGVAFDLTQTTLPEKHPWNGNMSLSLIGDGTASADKNKNAALATAPFGQTLVGSVGQTFSLKPGESRVITFLLTWYFPNRGMHASVDWTKSLLSSGDVLGNNYANWFTSSQNVAKWLKNNLSRLQAQTFSFHDAYYNHSSLPYWLNRRLMMPMSTLATETCQWWQSGKFWAWEGVGSCEGTCTHVWNYEQGMAHLFPELERNVREQTDFANSFQPDGKIWTRDGSWGWEMDGTAGTVLKAYREDLLSANHAFLNREWPKIKQTTKFLISQDKNSDGLIESVQPNTYDIAFYGANTYVGSLYLAALKATAKMAILEGDKAFADTCNTIAQRGEENTSKRLYNGEYFIQDVDLKAHPQSQYGKGCLADQLFGQTWADLYQLGDLYQNQQISSALESIYKYNWAPDVGPQNAAHPAERDYADPGEAGLFVCTWPHDPHPGDKGVRYRDEVWTGIEYQVATNMIERGMLHYGLSILKGLDNRYQPEKHNPWNEIECGDHYARAMASWGVLLALEDYQYDGPNQTMGFAPKLHPEHFESFFTSAEAWGNIAQDRIGNTQTNSITVKYGQLLIKQLHLQLASDHYSAISLSINGRPVKASVQQDGQRLTLSFPSQKLTTGHQLKITIKS